ncbi:MAG: bifunctional precorrin-2 dehydrogenase/sirohydrochlorin ferrochelatase, partial [Nitrospinae bacterium]|nr:bifunctional precorrin-2 dehydrogenase/sirohydrochlorin ferrochelatase [Nitrospinota bacterium]
KDVNRAVYQQAAIRRTPVNVADDPVLCSFTLPSLVQRGELTIAVSTGGASPAVARRLRERLESEFGDEWGVYLALMASLRDRAMREIHDPARRRALFAKLADSPLFDKVAVGDDDGAAALVEELFAS